jgi:DHA2 family multidrug resistance protein
MTAKIATTTATATLAGGATVAGGTQSANAVPLRNWLAVLGGVLGAFMAVLNIQVVNASLADIQGALGASLDEGSWISTSYLIAEIIVIPLTGWLSQVFGIKRYILGNVVFFVAFMIAGGFAWNLESMIAFRALAGFFGGALIPVAFTIILTRLPPAKQMIGFALFGLTATQAPSVGPTIGGWLSDNYGWQYIFYIQIIPGVLMFALLMRGLDDEAMRLGLLRQGDWLGIGIMAIGLASLEVMLEEGDRNGWFESDFIVRASWIAGIFLVAFVVLQLCRRDPVVNFRLFADRNFALGSAINTILGIGLYGTVFLVPRYLAQLQGFSAFQIGEVLMWLGLPQLIVVPIVLRLSRFVDARVLIATGCVLFAVSGFMNIYMTADSAFDQMMWSNVVRALSLPFIMQPVSGVATARISTTQAGSASALFNVMRNLGGAVGIAMVGAVLTWRQHLHSNVISEHLSALDPATQERLATLAQHFLSLGGAPELAEMRAIAMVDAIARRESFILAFSDCFFLMGVAFLVGLALVALLRRVEPGAGAGGAH